MIQRERIVTAAAVGADGSATSTGATICPLGGVIYSIHLAYSGSPPAGTVTTIQGVTLPYTPILAITGNGDQWVHVLHQAQSSADGSDITNQGQLVAIRDSIQVTISSCNAGDSVSVCLIYEVVR